MEVAGIRVVTSGLIPENGYVMMTAAGEVVGMGMIGKYAWMTTDRDLIRKAERVVCGDLPVFTAALNECIQRAQPNADKQSAAKSTL